MQNKNAQKYSKQEAYRARLREAGKCPHCGKPCAPYAECEDRRNYQRRKRGGGDDTRGEFSDKRFWPRRNYKPIGLDISLVERPDDKQLLAEVEKAIPRWFAKELRDELRQRLVLGVLEGGIPMERLEAAGRKIKRQIEMLEQSIQLPEAEDGVDYFEFSQHAVMSVMYEDPLEVLIALESLWARRHYEEIL